MIRNYFSSGNPSVQPIFRSAVSSKLWILLALIQYGITASEYLNLRGPEQRKASSGLRASSPAASTPADFNATHYRKIIVAIETLQATEPSGATH